MHKADNIAFLLQTMMTNTNGAFPYSQNCH